MRTNCAHAHSYAHPGATRRAPRLLRFVSFTENSRAEAGALIHSLQTGCLRKKKWRRGSRRTIIEGKKGEEENEIDFLTLFFTGCAGSDSRP